MKGFLMDPKTGYSLPFSTMEGKRFKALGIRDGIEVDILAVAEYDRWRGAEIPRLKIVGVDYPAHANPVDSESV
jgi:hypothetical protein